MKSRFKTNYNLSDFPKYEGEKDFGPSLTDPTGYQTIDQIIERCRRGVPLNIATHTPEYEFSNNLSDDQVEGIMDSVSRGVEDPDFDLADVPELKSFVESKNTGSPR